VPGVGVTIFPPEYQPVRESLEDLPPDERARYVAWWRKFKLVNNSSYMGLGILFLSSWANSKQVGFDLRPVRIVGLVMLFGGSL
jgi:hypothetical protein